MFIFGLFFHEIIKLMNKVLVWRLVGTYTCVYVHAWHKVQIACLARKDNVCVCVHKIRNLNFKEH